MASSCGPCASRTVKTRVDYLSYHHDVATSVMDVLPITDLHNLSRTSRCLRAVGCAAMRGRFTCLSASGKGLQLLIYHKPQPEHVPGTRLLKRCLQMIWQVRAHLLQTQPRLVVGKAPVFCSTDADLLRTTQMLKPRLSLWFTRSYATRIAEKPPARFPDPLLNHPDAVVKTLKDENLTFIHRPPPTAPSPYSTTLAPASPLLKSPTPSNKHAPMPPLLRPSAYNAAPSRMSDKDIEQLRKLRLSNPEKYSRAKLAKLFKCTPNFVSKVAALPRPQRKEFARKMEAEHETVRGQWGEKKATFVAIKQKRREFW